MMKCPKCNAENREGRKFCAECGAKLGWVCSKCGFDNEPDERFCGGCGHPLNADTSTKMAVPKLEDMQDRLYIPEPLRQQMDIARREMVGENRLVTALFADISGFTPMSQEMKPEAVVDKVNQCFQVITDAVYRYEGSINRFIGDGVLAFFGAPLTHEDDPERSILAALDMRKSVSQLGLNISVGINTGMTYFGAVGSQQHQETSAYGHDVNLASRLEGAASPGQILAGAGTYRLTRRAFDFRQLGEVILKGINLPVSIYEVLGAKQHPEKLRGIEGMRARIIGREREFADLKEAADDLVSGKGSIVSVIGDAGLGKSRLAQELREYLKDKKVTWYEGRCVSIGQTVHYWLFLDILKTFVNLSDTDSESEIAEKLKRAIIDLFPQTWADILPFLGQLLSVKLGDELDSKLAYTTSEQIRHQTLMRLRDIFVAISRRKPLLLILEDLHWADDLSLDLVSLLMDELTANPLMLLCIYRPEQDHRCWQIGNVASRKCLERYTEITLKQLSKLQSRQLVESLLEVENLPETTKDMILRKSEGNPFFIEELMRYLIDGGLVYREGDVWKASKEIEDIGVPDTIQSVLLSRVDRLEAETKYILQCASVIGRLFRYRLLDHLVHQERALDDHLSQLEERQLIHEERTVPEPEYAFKHFLTQEVTYQGILERRRKEFHQRVAEGIENLYKGRIEEFYEELAHHHELAGNMEKATEYHMKYGIKSLGITLAQLGLTPEICKPFYDAFQLPSGLILITGPMGSGKSTTLYSALREISISGAKILMVEDDAWGEVLGAIRGDTSTGIRCIRGFNSEGDSDGTVRVTYDRDAVLAGYDETFSNMIEAVLAGHLVLSCLDAYDTIDTLIRILDMGIKPSVAAQTVAVVLTQRLVRRLCDQCKQAIEPSAGLQQLFTECQMEVPDKIYVAVGCDVCRNGYEGRNAIYELLVMNDEIRRLMRQQASAQEIRSAARRAGMKTLIEDGMKKIAAGITSAEDVLVLDIARFAFPDDKIINAINWDQMDRLILGRLQREEGAGMVYTFANTQRLYARYGMEDRLHLLAERIKQLASDAMKEERVSQLLPEAVEFLEPGVSEFVETFEQDSLQRGWEWVDPAGDSTYRLLNPGMEINVLIGHDLWGSNLKAPRLLRDVEGDFILEIRIRDGAAAGRRGGGLLVWESEQNYIRFEVPDGTWKDTIYFGANVNGRFIHPGVHHYDSKEAWLRLERKGERFTGYFSKDGDSWYRCGWADISMKYPIRVGIHALCPEVSAATSTRFEYFKIFRAELPVSMQE